MLSEGKMNYCNQFAPEYMCIYIYAVHTHTHIYIYIISYQFIYLYQNHWPSMVFVLVPKLDLAILAIHEC